MLSPQSALERLSELVSAEVGLIRTLDKAGRGADEPVPPYVYSATLSHFDFRTGKPIERHGSGKGPTEREAMLGAIGEAVERYCASHVPPRGGISASWRSMEGRANPATDFVLYTERQYATLEGRVSRWNPEAEVRWTTAHELSGEEVFVPATLVYLSSPDISLADWFTPPTSNGLAAGPDFNSAALAATYELIERDAFMISWLARLPPRQVLFRHTAGLPGKIADHYEQFGVELRVYWLQNDLDPYVMMALTLDKDPSRPATLVGLGCHLDPNVALCKAILEISQGRHAEIRRYRDTPPQKNLQRYEDVRTLEDHSAYHTVHGRLAEFSFILDNDRQVMLDQLPNGSQALPEADLHTCVEQLHSRGLRVFYSDLTTPDVAPYPIRVVRALSTGLQPIAFGNGEQRLGGSRLYELPHKLGFSDSVLREDELNPCPHPLA